MKNENKNNHTSEKSDTVESANQIDKINLAKMRLSELEAEERKFYRRAEIVTERFGNFLPVPPLILAGDFFTAFLTFGAIAYHFYIQKFPDKIFLVTICVGLLLMFLSFYHHRKHFLQEKQKRRIERKLKEITDAKTKVEKIIDAAQRM